MDYQLTRHQWVNAPVSEVFDFFSRAENLGRLTPDHLGFDILTPGPIEMGVDTIIDYRIRLGPVPMKWRTRITEWVPGQWFTDEQERGPYRKWVHEHRFIDHGAATLMIDHVRYRPPFGLLGRAAHAAAIRTTLNGIFDYRFDQIEGIFGIV